MKKTVTLYYHAGSKNHGCEAIVRSTLKILQDYDVNLFSFRPEEDKFFQIPVNVLPLIINNTNQKTNKKTIKQLIVLILQKYFPKYILVFLIRLRRQVAGINYDKNMYSLLLNDKSEKTISIGGDNYCYEEMINLLYFLNKSLCEVGKKTILLGCSIEPKTIKNNNYLIKKDLLSYSLIIARESLTYNALLENGINKNTHLVPDPAFVLDTIIPLNLPKEYIIGNTVGINISPMVQKLEKTKDITYKNIVKLINNILADSDMNIALIPHVVRDSDNDKNPLEKLYKEFKNTGRVCFFQEDYNCMQIKGIISKCRFLVAARTHASIAGYSSQVPTLVIGYSVKSKGIAKDIFGTYSDYVISVQDLKKEDDILNSFKKLMYKEEEIRQHYKNFMPSYIEKVWQTKDLIEKLKD
ncbi:MAG: polysaccharide pyruvyl transferase family protein [Endomicrobiaceae bacterium]|nr:polysaccharide pyruvyl transferase family protein [Endomicrobiaceae bacterium]